MTSVHVPFDVRIFHKECKSIARAGYEVMLVAFHDRDCVIDGVKLKAIPRRLGRLSRMTKGVWAIYREAVRQNANVYHFHDPELIPVGLLMRFKGKAVVYDVHENVPEDITFKYYIPRSLRRPIAWLVGIIETGASHYFSAIVSATFPISGRFADRNPHTVVVSNYPIIDESQSRFPKSWSDRHSSVVYAGTLSEDRCVKEMVQAMAFLPKNLQATLKLAGAFSPNHLRNEISKTEGWKRVEELGVIDRSSVAALYDDARAGLVVLGPDAHFASAPIKLFEYMYAGIPVIASDFPEYRKVVEGAKCGVLVNPLDPKTIASAIEYILTHPVEAEQMGQNGREAAQAHYNWASEERKLLDLYAFLTEPLCAA